MIQTGKIIVHIFLLYILYFIGSAIQEAFHLSIPGSIIGMMLLFLLLLVKGIKLSWIKDGASFMNKHLVLFFIPATVGVIDYVKLFHGKGFFLIIIVVLSTFLVMIASGHVSQWSWGRKENDMK